MPCLFFIFGSESNFPVIREKIVKNVIDNWHIYNPYIIGDQSYGVSIKNESDYFNVMSKTGTYGGHLELHAATQIFAIFVTVFHPNGSVTELGLPGRNQIKVNLLYEGNGQEGHYSVLLIKDNQRKYPKKKRVQDTREEKIEDVEEKKVKNKQKRQEKNQKYHAKKKKKLTNYPNHLKFSIGVLFLIAF